MLTYKSYYNIAPTYLCELISRRESSVNTWYNMPPISKDCSNTFLERSYIYAAPCEWNKLNEYIITSNFDSFRKSVNPFRLHFFHILRSIEYPFNLDFEQVILINF